MVSGEEGVLMREAAGENLAERRQTAMIDVIETIDAIETIDVTVMIAAIETLVIEIAVMIVTTEAHPEILMMVSRACFRLAFSVFAGFDLIKCDPSNLFYAQMLTLFQKIAV